MIRLRQHGGHRRGQSMLEFAMIAPVLFLLLFGFLDVGRAYYQYVTLTSAVREGARFEAVQWSNLANATLTAADPAGTNTVQGKIQQVANSAGVTVINDLSHVTVIFFDTSGERPTGNACPALPAPCQSAHWNGTTVVRDNGFGNDHPRTGDLVDVKVIYQFKTLVPIVSQVAGNVLTLTSEAEIRLE